MIWLSCKPDKPNHTRPQKPSTNPPDPTTLTDGQRVEALQTRPCRVGQKITPKPEPPYPSPPLSTMNVRGGFVLRKYGI